LFGGYDDNGGAGATFAFAIDEDAEIILIIALTYPLPFHTGEFDLGFTGNQAVRSYEVSEPFYPLEDLVLEYPLLSLGLIDSDGIKELPAPVALLIDGN